jgi:hypothetical protein
MMAFCPTGIVGLVARLGALRRRSPPVLEEAKP